MKRPKPGDWVCYKGFRIQNCMKGLGCFKIWHLDNRGYMLMDYPSFAAAIRGVNNVRAHNGLKRNYPTRS